MKRNAMLLALTAAVTVGMAASAFASETLNFWFPTFASADGEVSDEEFWTEALAPWEEENDCDVNIGIVPWDNLIITYDRDGSIDLSLAEAIARTVLCI